VWNKAVDYMKALEELVSLNKAVYLFSTPAPPHTPLPLPHERTTMGLV